MRGRGEGHYEDVSELFGFLEMNDMTRVNQVKSAMTLDKLPALSAQLLESRGGPWEDKNFGAHGL
jgi:hypothetical protein